VIDIGVAGDEDDVAADPSRARPSRRATSAGTALCFKTESFTVHGTINDYVSIADSGNVLHRRFCPSCGTPMFSAAESRPHLVFVRAGTLDDAEIARPAMTIWTATAPSWACIADDLPRVERQPPPL
jgi:hypothetical protein